MKSRAPTDRRQQERRHLDDRRQLRIFELQEALKPLQDTVQKNAERIRELEGEQRVQLVRISQIQQELDHLKKKSQTR
jgi:hypothetical protein